MASIERTVYPRLKHTLTATELQDVYALTTPELALTDVWARGPAPRLALAILLKTFQRLGYFPSLLDVPVAIVDHLRSALGLSRTIAPTVTARTLYKYRQAIRDHLGVRPYGPDVLQTLVILAHAFLVRLRLQLGKKRAGADASAGAADPERRAAAARAKGTRRHRPPRLHTAAQPRRLPLAS
jgi:hypothetical protein